MDCSSHNNNSVKGGKKDLFHHVTELVIRGYNISLVEVMSNGLENYLGISSF